MTAKAETATLFHRLHEGPEPLLLPNAWDAGSARLIESLGAKAVATTSAGVAWTHGYPDGDVLPVRMLVATVVAIARVIRVPLTVDVEGGYSDDPAAVEETIGTDRRGRRRRHQHRGRSGPARPAVRQDRARQARRPAFRHRPVRQRPHRRLSARPGARGQAGRRNAGARQALSRCRRQRDLRAGPARRRRDQGDRRRCRPAAERDGVAGPAGRGELAQLGVRRLSAGGGIAQALWGKAAALAGDFLKTGKSEPLGEGAMAYPAINALFDKR